MRLFDGAIALLPCVTYRYYERCDECKDEATCGIRDVFADVRNETVRMLKASTLTEIMQRSDLLKRERKRRLTRSRILNSFALLLRLRVFA